MNAPREAFARIAQQPDAEIDLAEAALWIAAEEYPHLEVESALGRVASLAEAAASRLAGLAGATLPARVSALNDFLFREERFRGNRDDYYDPRNSYLNEVLERRLGIPISLAIVYLSVAERLGLEASGISFPGHFLLKCTGDETVVVDAFLGETLSAAECQQRLARAAGRPVRLDPRLHLRAATRREVLVRVLTNLKLIHVQRGDFGAALSCSDRILLLAPDSPREHKEREALRARVRLH